MRTKLLTSFVVVTCFWWAVSFFLWSSGPYSSNLGAFKDISALLEGWINLKPPIDVANTSLWDSWAVQWFVLMYWTGPVLLLTAFSAGIGSIKVWKHAAKFKKERDSREAAETTAYRGVGCTKGKLPRLGQPLANIHNVEIEGFSPDFNKLISEILSVIHEGYSNGTVYKGDEVEGDWMEYIEEKCQYVLEVSKEPELALVAALGMELAKITAYISKKSGPGKPIKFSKGGTYKTLPAEGAKQVAKLESWWNMHHDIRVAVVSVLRYLETPEFMPDGLFKDVSIKERVLTAIEDVYDIKPVESENHQVNPMGAKAANQGFKSVQPKAEPEKQAASVPKRDASVGTKVKPVVASTAESEPEKFETTYTSEQEAQIKESLAARFKTMQEQDGVKNTQPVSPSLDDMFNTSTDFAFPDETGHVNLLSEQAAKDSGPPWEEDKPAQISTTEPEPNETQKIEVRIGVSEHLENDAFKSEQVKSVEDSPSSKSGQENPQKKKKVVVDNTPAAGSFVMTPGAECMLEPGALDKHLDKAMLDLWPIMSFHSPNQPKGAQAFGWKQGKRIYLIEIKFREAVAKRIPAEVLEGLSPTAYNEKLNALSRELIAYFIRKGWLVNKIENVVLSAREPLWKIQAGLYEFNGVFALDVTPEIIDMLPTYNSKFQLSVIGCLWSHTIVSGRFPKRDADGNIVVDIQPPRQERKQKEHKQLGAGVKPGYKDPTQMNSLPSDLLAPNSGKFKKDIQAADDSLLDEQTKSNDSMESASSQVNAVLAVDKSESQKNKVSSTLRIDKLASMPESQANTLKSAKSSGIDLLSLVTSGAKAEKKSNQERHPDGRPTHINQTENMRPQGEKNRQHNKWPSKLAEDSPETEKIKVQSSLQKTSDSRGEESAVQQVEAKTKPEDSNMSEQALLVAVTEKTDIEPKEQGLKTVATRVLDSDEAKVEEEETESFSFNLIDIVAESNSLKAHIPDASESVNGATSSKQEAEFSAEDDLDVDSLLNDFESDIEKTRGSTGRDDKP